MKPDSGISKVSSLHQIPVISTYLTTSVEKGSTRETPPIRKFFTPYKQQSAATGPYATKQNLDSGQKQLQQPLVGQGPLFVETSRSHSDTPYSVLLLWTSDSPMKRPLPDISHNTHKRQITMLPAGYEPAIPWSERPQTQALDRADTGFDTYYYLFAPWSNILLDKLTVS